MPFSNALNDAMDQELFLDLPPLGFERPENKRLTPGTVLTPREEMEILSQRQSYDLNLGDGKVIGYICIKNGKINLYSPNSLRLKYERLKNSIINSIKKYIPNPC